MEKSIYQPDTTKLTIDDIPESLKEHEIFTFLDSKELFFVVRAVSTEWGELMKNLWCSKIKDEMIDQVKTIDFIYEKEVLTKTYEFKLKYLINYRNLLTLYNSNTNILLVVKSLIEQIQGDDRNEDLLKLITYFFTFLQIETANFYLEHSEYHNFETFLSDEENFEEYKEKFIDLVNVEKFHDYELEALIEFRNNFNLLSKENIENISENAKLIYSLLQGLIEYEVLKLDVKDLRAKIENLIKRIQDTTDQWPKKKKFFERAYKILLYTRYCYYFYNS